MPYRVNFYKAGQLIGGSGWNGSLETAKQHAREHFPIHKTQSGATHAVVTTEDGNNTEVYRFPSEKSDA